MNALIEDFRGAPKLHPPQLREHQLEMLNLDIPIPQRLATLTHETLQSLDIVGQFELVLHDNSISSSYTPCTIKILRKAGFLLGRELWLLCTNGVSPIDPFKQHRQLRTT